MIFKHASLRVVLLGTITVFNLLPAVATDANTRQEGSTDKKVPALFRNSRFSGEFQTEMQYCLPDSTGDLSPYVKKFLSNSYLDLRYTSQMLDIGMRGEMYENPLPGFEQNFKGAGVPYFYLTLNLQKVQITVGDFYEQFGDGLILRSYYERALGVDNALRGGRLTAQPARWIAMKLIGGKQRYYWSWSEGTIGGADVRLQIDQMSRRIEQSGHQFEIGGSWVSNWQQQQDILVSPTERLRLPHATAAFSGRLHYRFEDFSLRGEYAYKINDPSADNNYIYRPGQALLLMASYARKGFGVTLGAKHTDNMVFRSDRTATGRMQMINYLPAFSREQGYSLANMYPYATQPQGEVAFQLDAFYKIKRHTALGGKYGTDIRLNASRVNSLEKDFGPGNSEAKRGTYGYTTHLFALGKDIYYQDVNLDITRRFTPGFKLSLFYMNQIYNQLQIEGHANDGEKVYANIFALETTNRLGTQMVLRTEVQYLMTRQDQGDWVAGLLELSVSPHFLFSVGNTYNLGVTRKNYLMGSVAYTTGAHRVQLSGGQQRAGITCIGGICRYVPATNGVSLSYTVNFSVQKK